MYRSLNDYIARLEREGELIRIAAPVSPVEEIAEITDRISKTPGGGKALLFENTGTDFPVATNLFGSERRMALALGVESLDDLSARIDDLLGQATAPRNSLADKLRALPMLAEMARWFPRTASGRGACQQVVALGETASLAALPVLKCWPRDGGRFVTLPMVNTLDPETGVRNVGMYRMQLFGERETGMHWHIHKTGARHYDAYKRLGRRMPVAVALGGDPAYTYAATAPMPDNMDEYLLAGFLRRRAVKLVKCITNDIYVPADCDFVIEGYVDPAEEKVVEGPFGDHTGFYSLEDRYPLFHVTAVTHRRDAVYPATVVGIPPEEDAWIARATERIFLAPIRMALQPEIRDLTMPEAGTAHNVAVVAIDRRYEGQAVKVVQSLWGAGQMMFNKYMLVVSSGTDVRDARALARLVRNLDPSRDLIRSEGILDVLDHATATPGFGGKIAWDTTAICGLVERVPATGAEPDPAGCNPGTFAAGRLAGNEPAGAAFPADLAARGESGPAPAAATVPAASAPAASVSAATAPAATGAGDCDSGQGHAGNLRTDLLEEWGVVVSFAEPGAEVRPPEGVKYLAVFDPAAAELTPAELLWLGAANTDPRRDVTLCGATLVIDARSKRPGEGANPGRFPNVVTASEATVELVDRRWAEYGLGPLIASPSRRYRRLLRSEGAEW